MPVLHVLAGPNGSGKSTYVAKVLQPVTCLPFVNADVIAATRWPGAELDHAYEASRAAADERRDRMNRRESFITETVFSHPSKNELIDEALSSGYIAHLHVMMIPVDLAVARVADRVRDGGHEVPVTKIRERFERLWGLLAQSLDRVDRADLFDNSRTGEPFRRFVTYERGRVLGTPDWPLWAPYPLRQSRLT